MLGDPQKDPVVVDFSGRHTKTQPGKLILGIGQGDVIQIKDQKQAKHPMRLLPSRKGWLDTRANMSRAAFSSAVG